ncbi:hypothetical protein Sjap_015724 [Stephania japonica]|uniref:Uncharacterized protein n=1 Tax=Stephania japonica TaxID=461633 RepID=A0AAP0ILL5_9MAGN
MLWLLYILSSDFAAAMQTIKKFLLPREDHLIGWDPPLQRFVKLNIDGYFVSNLNWASVGALSETPMGIGLRVSLSTSGQARPLLWGCVDFTRVCRCAGTMGIEEWRWNWTTSVYLTWLLVALTKA